MFAARGVHLPDALYLTPKNALAERLNAKRTGPRLTAATVPNGLWRDHAAMNQSFRSLAAVPPMIIWRSALVRSICPRN